MVGVILAAGNGERLKKSSGENCCKVLKKINNLCLVEYAINYLIEISVTNVFIVVGKDGELIKKALNDKYKNLNITYVYQSMQRGLINALMQALNVHVPEDTVLMLADEVFVGLKVESIADAMKFVSHDYSIGITYEADRQKIKANYSVELDQNMYIKRCTEKPEHIINNIKGTGFCIFGKQCLCLLKDIYDEQNNTPNNLCDFVNLLAARKFRGVAFEVADTEFNINTATDLAKTTDFIRQEWGGER